MFCGLGEEERTKIRKKKKEEKRNKPHRGQKWVGWDDFLGPHFGGFPVELPQKISGVKIAFAAQQLYTKIRFPCFVV